jgi:hypothetical protein
LFIGVLVEEVEKLARCQGQGTSMIRRWGPQFDLVAFDAADDEGLGGVPADLFVLGNEQPSECVDRVAVGLRGEEPVGLEERADPPIGVSQGPGAYGSFSAADFRGDGFPGGSGDAEFRGRGKDGLGRRLGAGHGGTLGT